MSKLLSVDKIRNIGWEHRVKLDDGIRLAYEWYLKNCDV